MWVEEIRNRIVRLHLIWFIMICLCWFCAEYRDLCRTVTLQFKRYLHAYKAGAVLSVFIFHTEHKQRPLWIYCGHGLLNSSVWVEANLSERKSSLFFKFWLHSYKTNLKSLKPSIEGKPFTLQSCFRLLYFSLKLWSVETRAYMWTAEAAASCGSAGFPGLGSVVSSATQLGRLWGRQMGKLAGSLGFKELHGNSLCRIGFQPTWNLPFTSPNGKFLEKNGLLFWRAVFLSCEGSF